VVCPTALRVGSSTRDGVQPAGETFLLGATTWKIDEITSIGVVVHAAPGQPVRCRFGAATGPGRPLELGRTVGEFVPYHPRVEPSPVCVTTSSRTTARRNLVQYLDDQARGHRLVARRSHHRRRAVP